MDKETIKAAKRFVFNVRKKFAVQKILLFGSRARGDNFVESDYDFLIVSGDFEGKDFTGRMVEMLKYWDEKNDLEAFCYTPAEFERKKKDGLVKQALKEGVARFSIRIKCIV